LRILRGRGVVVGMVATATVLFGMSGSGWAKAVRTKVHATLKTATTKTTRPQVLPEALAQPAMMPNELEPETEAPTADGATNYRLRMDNIHTGEKIDIVYRIGNTYVPEALAKLNSFLRDHNTQDVIDYDPKEFDVLHAMMTRLGRVSDGVIDVVCGYRTPETNQALRHSSAKTGVAEHSQHMEGHAIDLRVPGVSTVTLRNAVLSLHAGGVGYYPTSQFVHVDVGPVRQWVFGRAPARPAAKSTHAVKTSAGM
jgi:uncharacterized protein YcbK (DUF882 family)